MKLFSRRYGAGPPLLILHGLYGSSDNWVTVAKALRQDFSVYLPDLRNHGQSGHSDEHNYNVMSSDIHEFVLSEGIRKFFLAGHSMGGKCAVAFALRWPEMLNGLLVADISPFRNGRTLEEEYKQHLKILSAIAETDLSTISSRKEVEETMAARIGNERITGLILKNLQRGHDNSFSWKLNAASLRDNLDNIIKEIVYPGPETEEVTGFPVLFIRGERSAYLPEEDFSMIRMVFPAAEFRSIGGAGHWLHADNPPEVIESILSLRRMAD